MNRFAPYLGIVAALFLGMFVVSTFDYRTVSPVSPAANSVPQTLFVIPALSPSSPPVLPEEINVVTTTPSPTPAAEKKVPTPSPIFAKPVSVPVPSPTPISAAMLDASASALREALVNIVCYVSAGSGLHSISGSGVFIDPKGIILTNAHIAQYFLLADRDVSCVIRSGSPATDNYDAALIYISPAWVRENVSVLTQHAPSGTGEYDFALIAVTKSAKSTPLPAAFPSVPLAHTPPESGAPVVIASYGAQFLEANQIQSSLFPTIVFGSVKDVFTFARNTIDVLALGGSAAAQEGSSGGGVADASGVLVGTITTSTIEGDTSTRSLSAITASYIRAEYASETGEALDLLLDKPISVSISDFAGRIPELEAMLTVGLP